MSRNTTDYELLDAQFRSNITDLETRYRRLERELPDFIAQNDRIRETLQRANDTFRTEGHYQLSRRRSCILILSHSISILSV